MTYRRLVSAPRLAIRRLLERPVLRRIIENSGWLLAERAAQIAVGLFVGVVVARHLGPTSFGLLSYAQSLAVILAGLVTLGLDALLLRDLVSDADHESEILGSAAAVRACAAVAALGVSVCWAFATRGEDIGAVAVILVMSLLVLVPPLEAAEQFYLARMDALTITIAGVVALMVGAAARLGLVGLDAPLVWFALALVGQRALRALGLVVKLARVLPLRTLRASVARCRGLLRDGWPLLLSGTLVLLNMQVDRLMLGSLRGDTDVGVYSVAMWLSELWYAVPVMVGAAAMPALTKAFDTDRDSYEDGAWHLLRAITWAGIIATACVAAVAAPLIRWLFGAAYADAANVLVIHVFGGVFVGFVSIRSRLLLIERLQRFVPVFAGGATLVNVVLNAAWIPRYSVVGAAWASVLSWAAAVLVMPLAFSNTRRFVSLFLRAVLCPLRRMRQSGRS